MTAGFERGRDVLETERLDLEERTEAETVVARHGTEQQDVHRESCEAIIAIHADQGGARISGVAARGVRAPPDPRARRRGDRGGGRRSADRATVVRRERAEAAAAPGDHGAIVRDVPE